MDEFGCFSESESLNDAPLIEATTDSAPVCLKRPPRRCRIDPAAVLPLREGRRLPLTLWIGRTFMPTGPPYEFAA